jgi:hypothetical protein
MSSKHTPGPWRTDENGHIVCYPEGLSVGVLSKQLPEGELKANHLLIVSAPDLLAALYECEAYFDNRADADCDQDGFIPNEEMKLLSEVREALRKAGAA